MSLFKKVFGNSETPQRGENTLVGGVPTPEQNSDTETPEQKPANIDEIFSSLLALRESQEGLENFFTHEAKPGTKQKIESGPHTVDELKPRRAEDFTFSPNTALLSEAITRDVTGDGEIPVTPDVKAEVEKEVETMKQRMEDVQKKLHQAQTQIFRSPELQEEIKKVFGDKKIKNWEQTDETIKTELKPFFELWQKKQEDLQAEYRDQQKQTKGTIDNDERIEQDNIPDMSAWQLTGYDNPTAKLAKRKQKAFKDLLTRIFTLPGGHQKLKEHFFTDGKIIVGDGNSIKQLLQYFDQEKTNARKIDIDYSLDDISGTIKKAEQALTHIPEIKTPEPGESGKKHEDNDSELEYNREVAERLKLEQLDITAYREAQKLIQEVIAGTIDITKKDGQKAFITQWNENCPDIPMPCVPDKNYYWYLTQLQNNKIISNLTGENKPSIPNWDREQTILIDNSWQEVNWDKTVEGQTQKELQTIISPLLQELMGDTQTGVTRIKRQDIDTALWEGDPGDRKQSPKAREIVQSLDLDPEDYELRLIAQDEYARLATTKGWGQSNLWTQFDNYFLGDVDDRSGLVGGTREYGGASSVDRSWRANANEAVGVRLVLSRKHE